MQQISAIQKRPFPPVIVIQVKGAKGYSNAGLTATLLDFTKQDVTLIDATNKALTTVYVGVPACNFAEGYERSGFPPSFDEGGKHGRLELEASADLELTRTCDRTGNLAGGIRRRQVGMVESVEHIACQLHRQRFA
jgi:hypothetical protein